MVQARLQALTCQVNAQTGEVVWQDFLEGR